MTNEISASIRYVGADDLDLDLFESQYIVPDGMAYNAYVILDEKIALMDTIDRRKAAEWVENVEHVLEGRKPDYLVVHHLEPDHASQIAVAMAKYPGMKLVCSKKAADMLPQFFVMRNEELIMSNGESRIVVVAEGDTLCLGQHTLTFIAAPMVHWPEVLMSYESTEKVLFSADGFGKFGAICNEHEGWACEARRYYFNICGKYGAQVQAVLKKAAALDIKTIAPLHGPVLTGDLTPYLSLYDTWSAYRPEKQGVFVAYASIHGNTAEAAKKLAEMIEARGIEVEVKDLSREDLAESIESAFEMSHTIVCASSYDAGVFPIMHDFLHHLQIKNWQNRTVGLLENGSWAPCAGRVMRQMLEQMKGITILEPMVTIKSTMKSEDLPHLEALADAVAASFD